MQVGIIHIEDQDRPVYLTRDFGKLKKHEVTSDGEARSIRRSRRHPTKSPDGRRSGSQLAELTIEFAGIDGDDSLGTHISWDAECCEMPPGRSIPDLKADGGPTRYPYGIDLANLDLNNRISPDYYRQRAEYEFARRVFRPVRLAVRNVGPAAANSACGPNSWSPPRGQWCSIPRKCQERPADAQASTTPPWPASRQPSGDPPGTWRSRGTTRGRASRSSTATFSRVAECAPDVFSLGIAMSGDVALKVEIFADNLPQSKDFTLTISANVSQTRMTVAELRAPPEPVRSDS